MPPILRALPLSLTGILLAGVARAQDELAQGLKSVQAGDELHEPVAHHAASPVPQFDPSIFPGQLFWLAIIFALLYLVMSRLVLPKIGTAIDNRAAQIARDLNQAQQDRTLAGALLNTHETRLADTRVAAQAASDRALADASKLQLDELGIQGNRLAEMLQSAEIRIQVSRAAALAELAPAAALATQAVITKLTGMTASSERAQAEVDKSLKTMLKARIA